MNRGLPTARVRPRRACGRRGKPRFGRWRRRAIAVIYCLVLIGTPIGHAGLLGLHLIGAHGWRPVSTRLSERIQHQLNVALLEQRTGTHEEHAHTHPAASDPHAAGDHVHHHDHPAARAPLEQGSAAGVADRGAAAGTSRFHASEATATSSAHEHGRDAAEQGARGASDGLHAHDGLVHSHEPDLAQRLATLTSKLSEHYLEVGAVELPLVVSLETTEWGEPHAYPTVYRRIESPPPRV